MFDYMATLNGTRAWQGSMVIDGDQMMISTEGVGREGENAGTYTWTFDGTNLSFQLVSDGCLTREAILLGHPWVRQP